MQIGKIISNVVSTIKHPAYNNKPVFLIQPLDEKLLPRDKPWVAVDCIGSQINDIILFGGAPGVAQEVFQLEKAPIRSLIIAKIDIIEVDGVLIYHS